MPPKLRKRVSKRIEKEQAKSRGEEMFPKLVEQKGDMPVIKDQLPTIFHAEGHPPGEVQQAVRDALAAYRATLPSAYQSLLDRYELRDAAIKVVGVGSVGTHCWVLLFMAGDGDPLFLQVKEARALGPGAVRRARASSRTTASASWTATGSCSPPATCSSGGAGDRSATSSSASCGT